MPNPGQVLDGTVLEARNLARIQAKLEILPPLPQASATQSGYLSASDFAKFNAVDVPLLTNLYTFTNATPLRTIDVATGTLTDALNCLAALVDDLKAAGILPP